ncbi:MAG: hypothetical protein HQL57_08050, partial [Magnetococcales bacterium]|nr:hypothetical protein [Magnetococcales bacterium]
EDCRAWREGVLDSLEARLGAAMGRAVERLTEVAAEALSLGMIPSRQIYRSSHAVSGESPLRFSRHGVASLEELLVTHYVPCPVEVALGQKNLFLDDPGTLLVNDLIAALVDHDLPRVENLLGRLREAIPDHAWLVAFARLGGAIADLQSLALDPSLALEVVRREIVPAAEMILGERSERFLRPFWRVLEGSLRGVPFDSTTPDLHGSWFLERLGDWQGVRQRVEAEERWEEKPELLLRLARASFRLGLAREGIRCWILLCWDFPIHAERVLEEEGGEADTTTRALWNRFQEADTEPELETALFPAWLLFSHPWLASLMSPRQREEESVAEGLFFQVAALLKSHATSPGSAESLRLRRELASCHRGLFACFLAHLGRSGQERPGGTRSA